MDLLLERADAAPSATAYTFLDDGGGAGETLDYEAFARRVLAVAGLLQEAGARGEPVLLLFPPGLDYVAAFMGCVCAGAIAVPAYPPDPQRLGRTLPRLASLVADARARFALTTGMIRTLVEAMGPSVAGDLAEITWIAIEQADDTSRRSWRNPAASPDDTAFLQYTSGSTGSPRGVVLSHANLLHNSAAIYRCFGHGPDSRGVIWLPPYHDMGLIGGVLQPLYGGFPVVLMSPLSFLVKPLRWLKAISDYRGTTSGGPNFAYDLCVRKVTEEERASLDLSSWDLAFNGAEPIHPETLDRFAAAFGPCGFRREAFYPCYGLAEGTLIVSGGEKGRGASVRRFVGSGFDRGEAARSKDEAGRGLVGSGASLVDQEVHIVDPQSHKPLAEGQVGEIWVRGPSVARGYWKREEETLSTFQARRADDATNAYLRTGDLGFFMDGELFVTGRLKDLVIIRGRNLYPQDIERTAIACHPGLRPGCAAAFAVETAGEEQLAIVLEADPRKLSDATAVIDDIRRAVAEEHDVLAQTIVLLGPGSVPKTSSGKIQRRGTREQLLAGGFTPLAESVLTAAPTSELGMEQRPVPQSRDAWRALPEAERTDALVALLRSFIAELLGVAASAVAPERPLSALGFDSIKAVELAGRIEEELGVMLPMSIILDGGSAAALAARLAGALDASIEEEAPASARDGVPLSLEQERLLFLHQLAASDSAYHIATAVFLDGQLDRQALARSIAALIDRHAVLRAHYPRHDGRWSQVIAPPGEIGPSAAMVESEVSASSDGDLDAAALRVAHAEAQRPFDLERGPVLRARCVRIGPTRHLLVLVIHHIAADGWSMGVIVRDLGELYSAFVKDRPASLPPLTMQYADFAARQRRWIASGGLAPELDHWKRRLAGAPLVLDLPGDHPRPPSQSFAGARCPVTLDEALTGAVRHMAAAAGATLYMVLLAGFLALVHQRTGREDLVVGTDIAGRGNGQAQRLVGLFVNQMVLRVDASDNPSFQAFVGRVRATALDAYAHDRVPFDKLVEALRPPRDPRYNPLFQLMFVLESAPLPNLSLPGLRAEIVEINDAGAPFDLSVLLSEQGGLLRGVFRYSTALFEPATIAAMVEDYIAVLAAATARPEVTLAEISALVLDRARNREEAQADALRAARLERFRTIPKR